MTKLSWNERKRKQFFQPFALKKKRDGSLGHFYKAVLVVWPRQAQDRQRAPPVCLLLLRYLCAVCCGAVYWDWDWPGWLRMDVPWRPRFASTIPIVWGKALSRRSSVGLRSPYTTPYTTQTINSSKEHINRYNIWSFGSVRIEQTHRQSGILFSLSRATCNTPHRSLLFLLKPVLPYNNTNRNTPWEKFSVAEGMCYLTCYSVPSSWNW